MRWFLAGLCMVACALLVIGCGGGESEESGGGTTADGAEVAEGKETAPPSDEPTISELDFSLEGYNYEGMTDAEGLKPGGGTIGKLLCEGHEIPLAAAEFQRGFIVTQDYGKLKIRFAPKMTDEAFAIWTTPEQEKALAEFVGK